MTTYAGGTRVRNGYYVDTKGFSIVNMSADGKALPGAADARWVRVPTAVVMALAPVVGGAFVVALPFIGFGLVAWAAARAVTGGLRAGAKEVAATVTPGWTPGEAHLTGHAADEGAEAGAAPAKDEKLEALEKEIAEKRETK